MKDIIKIVGPCSKFVDGRGWTTEIPVKLLNEQGYYKSNDVDKSIVTKIKRCPFCGKHGTFMLPFGDEGKWNLDHYCKHPENDLSIVIHVYGKSKEEVIEKWNNRIRKQ